MSDRLIVQEGSHLILKCAFDMSLLAKIKALPGRTWDQKKRVWKVPAKYRINVERFAYANGFQFAMDTKPEETFDVPDMPELTVSIPLKMEMFDFQKTGVAYSIEKQRNFISDEPGLGKTVQSIASVLHLNTFPCLVICPNSAKINWQREWHMWTDKKAMILDDSIKATFPRYWEHGYADVFIVNFESLKKYFIKKMPDKGQTMSAKNMEFKNVDFLKAIIVDESHRVKSFETQATKFTFGIAEGKEVIYLLSGTPVMNKPADLVPQLGIMGRLNDFGGYKPFLERYCSGKAQASNLKELNQKLRLTCFYQRRKSEVLKDLPAKMRQIVYCNLDNRDEYKACEKDLIGYIKKYESADDEKIRSAERGNIMVQMGKLKFLSARGKLRDVFEYVDDIMASGQKLVLFAYLKDIVARIKERYPNCVTLTGDDNAAHKQASIDKFQNDPSCLLFVGNIIAAGVAITLTAASRVGFIEQWWNPAIHDQAEDRCHRIGQVDSVNCIYFHGTKTIDEKIYKIIDKKRGIVSAVMGNEEVIEESVFNDLLDLFKHND